MWQLSSVSMLLHLQCLGRHSLANLAQQVRDSFHKGWVFKSPADQACRASFCLSRMALQNLVTILPASSWQGPLPHQEPWQEVC